MSTWQGWLYVAFVIDVFARRIVGWRISRNKQSDFVRDALEQALYYRQPAAQFDPPIGQGLAIREHQLHRTAGPGRHQPAVGSKGDHYDIGLAKTINVLYEA